MMTQGDDKYSTKLVEKVVSLHEQVSKMQNIIEDQKSHEKMLTEDLDAKTAEVQDLEAELQIYKLIAGMALENTQRTEMYIMNLGKKIDARSSSLVELKTQWNAFTKSFEERRALVEQELYADKPDQLEKLQQLKEIELETGAILSELRKREEERSRLAADLENQPKIPPRRSYLRRITEITKNSRKLDSDIEQIMRDTRELQLESNSINERLHRVYAVVNEAVSREAKSDVGRGDPVRKNVYRLLGGIRSSFQEISDKILLTDRIRRESADLQAKLAALAPRTTEVNRLQSDLDAIVKENELLEQEVRRG